MTRAGQSLAALRRLALRAKSPLLVALLALALAACALFAARWILAAADARAVAALNAGRDLAIPPDAADARVMARVLFFAKRGRVDEAQALVEALDRRGSPLLAPARDALANARMRAAFTMLEAGRLEEAGPLVNLARADYRAALTLDPELWDARYNLDVASRLVRDFPSLGETRGDDAPQGRERMWSDAPGRPKGLP
ncbi:hypothetical protein [Methylocella sp.]|uniref:hypothetical protein n=1 Tax=Methylocella sp. TaxID=1978226 RepID=UPI00378342D2